MTAEKLPTTRDSSTTEELTTARERSTAAVSSTTEVPNTAEVSGTDALSATDVSTADPPMTDAFAQSGTGRAGSEEALPGELGGVSGTERTWPSGSWARGERRPHSSEVSRKRPSRLSDEACERRSRGPVRGRPALLSALPSALPPALPSALPPALPPALPTAFPSALLAPRRTGLPLEMRSEPRTGVLAGAGALLGRCPAAAGCGLRTGVDSRTGFTTCAGLVARTGAGAGVLSHVPVPRVGLDTGLRGGPVPNTSDGNGTRHALSSVSSGCASRSISSSSSISPPGRIPRSRSTWSAASCIAVRAGLLHSAYDRSPRPPMRSGSVMSSLLSASSSPSPSPRSTRKASWIARSSCSHSHGMSEPSSWRWRCRWRCCTHWLSSSHWSCFGRSEVTKRTVMSRSVVTAFLARSTRPVRPPTTVPRTGMPSLRSWSREKVLLLATLRCRPMSHSLATPSATCTTLVGTALRTMTSSK